MEADLRPAKVSKELSGAAYEDFKRKAIDEAKKRAVAQRVDYDTFKNMVLTAHLKPTNAPSQPSSDKPMPCWRFGVDGKLLKEQVTAAHLHACTPTEAPSTSDAFQKDWRRNCPAHDDKYRYLKLCGPEALRSIFRVEVSAETLRELLVVLDACWLGHAGAAEEADAGAGAALREAAFVAELLAALSEAGRFSLTARLLGSSSKPVLERLFAGLEAAASALEGQAEGEAAEERRLAPGALEQLAALRKAYGLA
ncbi:hypothetical protein HYH03_015167 [Edaphochlamys debaryana]|uniref:Dynein attachment factor N-terminal domain-containing protein n=1 Tax=Edaphochlamys debaryana TaxID=47281 RepID=A0A836BRI4_9CHLO|nr:hypothetical protein HYH03_015167 [Edaphochlamys debaryana]|eukprot:KAG2486205.1 hypothetical protein HYH03_015167 [Edaphochlamys debaryana]